MPIKANPSQERDGNSLSSEKRGRDGAQGRALILSIRGI